MKKIIILLPILTLLPLTGCSKPSYKGGLIEKDDYYVIKSKTTPISAETAYTGKNGDTIKFSTEYSEDYFTNQIPDKLNLALAKSSFSLAMSSGIPSSSSYLRDIGFKDLAVDVVADNYSESDSVHLLMGHKKIGDREMIAISVRGYDYSDEWSSNFYIGLEGDHNGFHNAAYNVIDELKDYLDRYNLNENLSFWIAGYSRGGATLHLTAKYLSLDSQNLIGRTIDTSHMYVYTYEAPKCSLMDNAHDYSFIHNLYNKNDFLAMNFPYDFTLVGKMHEYTHLASSKEDVISNGQAEDPTFEIPKYANKKLSLFPMGIVDDPSSTMSEEEFYQTLLKTLYADISSLSEEDSQGMVDVHTRENYVNNLQSGIQYTLALAFSLSDAQMETIMNYVNENMMTLAMVLMSGSGQELYNNITPALDQAEVSYVPEELLDVCNQLAPYVRTVIAADDAKGLTYLVTAIGNFSLIYANHFMTGVSAYLKSIPIE